eukprot:gene4307-14418_t
MHRYNLFGINTDFLVNARESAQVDDVTHPLARLSIGMVEGKLLARKTGVAVEKLEALERLSRPVSEPTGSGAQGAAAATSSGPPKDLARLSKSLGLVRKSANLVRKSNTLLGGTRRPVEGAADGGESGMPTANEINSLEDNVGRMKDELAATRRLSWML